MSHTGSFQVPASHVPDRWRMLRRGRINAGKLKISLMHFTKFLP
jgi:hypothetical protein